MVRPRLVGPSRGKLVVRAADEGRKEENAGDKPKRKPRGPKRKKQEEITQADILNPVELGRKSRQV